MFQVTQWAAAFQFTRQQIEAPQGRILRGLVLRLGIVLLLLVAGRKGDSSGKHMVISPTAWREFRGCWWLMIARCWFIYNSFMLCGRYFQLVHGDIIQLKTGGCTALYLGKTSPATKNCGFHQICAITNHDSTPGMGIPWPLAAHPVHRVIRSMYRPIHTSAMYPLVLTNSLLLNMAIYSEFSHEKWWFSIAMLSLPEGKCSILWTNKGEIYPWEYNANHNGDIMGHTVWAVMSRPLFPYPMLIDTSTIKW